MAARSCNLLVSGCVHERQQSVSLQVKRQLSWSGSGTTRRGGNGRQLSKCIQSLQIWGEEALEFQEKLLNSSGLGDETYFPDSASHKSRSCNVCSK